MAGLGKIALPGETGLKSSLSSGMTHIGLQFNVQATMPAERSITDLRPIFGGKDTDPYMRFRGIIRLAYPVSRRA